MNMFVKRKEMARTNITRGSFSMAKAMLLLIVTSMGMISASVAVSAVPKLTVSGSQILVGNTAEGMAGNSFFWSNNGWGGERFYNASTVRWLKNDWENRIVRAAMGVEDGGGYLEDPTSNVNRVKVIVDTAIEEDLYVLIDWHSHHAEDHEAAAVSFFREMAQTYGSHNNVIYEIYNEPLNNVSWSNTVKPYAEAVIAAIRQEDPDNLIVVGSPTWSQDVHEAAADPITGYDNIAYALHFYAGTHKQWLRDRADQAMDAGIALMVTEWGTVNANGDGDVDTAETNAWVDWMERNNITHLNWAVNDKVEGASIVKEGSSTTGGWSNSDLTASGRFVKDIIEEYNGGNTGGGGGNTNQAPSVSFSSPSNNLQVDVGYDLAVVVEASDSDGSIDNVRLYINDDFVRQESVAPYEWGHAGSPDTNELNGLSAGEYTFRVEAIDNGGRMASDTFVLTVRQPNNGGGGGGGGGTCQDYDGGRMEVDLQSSSCIDFGRDLSGRTLQVWDSDTNTSCNFRGTVSSVSNSESLTISSNYVSARNEFTGTELNFASNNNCRYVKVRVY